MQNITIESWPFIGPFHNKPVIFMGTHNGKTVLFSEGTFFVKFWTGPRSAGTREFTNVTEMQEFINE